MQCIVQWYPLIRIGQSLENCMELWLLLCEIWSAMGYCMLLLNDLCLLLGKEMFLSKWFTVVCDPQMCRWFLYYVKWALGVYRHFNWDKTLCQGIACQCAHSIFASTWKQLKNGPIAAKLDESQESGSRCSWKANASNFWAQFHDLFWICDAQLFLLPLDCVSQFRKGIIQFIAP